MNDADLLIRIGFLGAIITLVFKLVYDYLNSGRIEKGVYMKISDCNVHREKCCLPQVKRDTVALHTRMDAVDKRLDRGGKDFRMIQQDIGEMKQHMAGMKGLLEVFVEQQRKR